MGRPCSLCPRPDRAAIDAALLAGERYRNIAPRFGTSPASLSRHRAHLWRVATGSSPGLEYRNTIGAFRNSVVCQDALDLLRGLPDGSVDVWWASPPYNKADPLRGGNSVATKLRHRYAGGHGRGDGSLMPEDVYQAQQVAVLDEWHRTLTDDGVAFYSHQPRVKGGRLIHPVEWASRSRLAPLQQIIWSKSGNANTDPRRFYLHHEVVLVLAKRPGVRLRNVEHRGDVWRDIPSVSRKESGHPCATPPELVRRCLVAVPRPPDGRHLLVGDCYAGTGTTGIVARDLGMDYLLGDQSQESVDLSRRNLAEPVQLGLLRLGLLEEAAG